MPETKTQIQIKEVVKRDGSLEPFDIEKLKGSIRAALKSAGIKHNPVDGEIAEGALSLVRTKSQDRQVLTRDIREAAQAVLYAEGYGEAAQSYIIFRYLPKTSRNGTLGNA